MKRINDNIEHFCASSLSMMTRVLRKCQFTEQSDRNLLSKKMEKEIMSLEKWFQNMASSLNERVTNKLIN